MKVVIVKYPDPGYTSDFCYLDFKNSIASLVVASQVDVYKLERALAFNCKVIGEIVLDEKGNLVGTPVLPKEKQVEPEKQPEKPKEEPAPVQEEAPQEVTEVQNGEEPTQPIQGQSTKGNVKPKRGRGGR